MLHAFFPELLSILTKNCLFADGGGLFKAFESSSPLINAGKGVEAQPQGTNSKLQLLDF